MKDKSSHSVTVILGGSNPQCQVPEVQALVSNFTLYGTLIAGILSAITSPIYGSFSDRYGRTKILAICTAGMLFSEVIFIIAATYSESVSVEWVLVGYLFDGICGSFTTVMALIFAYGSDCTSPSKRNVVFGYFHGILFGGIALGPILAGIIVKASGHIITIFYFALGCHCLFSLYLLLVVPDSLSMERQVVAREKKAAKELEDYVVRSWFGTTANYLKGSNFFAPLATLYPTGEGSSSAVRQNLVLLAAVDTTMFGVAMGALSVVILYSELMFGWGTFESTIFVSIVNTCRVVVLLIILPAINRIFRGPRTQPQKNSGSDMLDLSIIRTAIGFDLVGYLGYATVRTGPLFILSGAVGSFGGVGSPTLQAAITKHVPHDLTGQVLGAMGLLHALARVVAPTVFNLIYSMTVGTCPQAVFIGLASMFGLAFVMSWFIRPHGEYFTVQPLLLCILLSSKKSYAYEIANA